MIQVHDVTVQRAGRAAPVLEGVSFALEPGERVAVLGGNGSGKTTLGRLLNGTLLPARGRVLVAGQDTRDPQTRVAVRRAVGFLFQDPDDQFVTTSSEREIAFGLENLRTPRAEMQQAVSAALHDFGLEAHRHTPPHALSGGEKARLALACVWVMQPRALVLDETESLLDRRGREQLAAMLAALPPSTILLRLTTDADAAAACPRVLVVHAGRLLADGDPDAVFARLPPEVVARTGLPLAWRVSASLAARGAMASPTTSASQLATALQGRSLRGAAGVESSAPSVAVTPPARELRDGFLLRALDVHYRYEIAGLGGSAAVAPGGMPAAERDALRGITLTLRARDRVALLGVSGAGKTTLLHVLAGLLRPQRGGLEWAADWDGMPSLVCQFAERQLFAPTVREDVGYGLRESGVPRDEVAARVRTALEDVGLQPDVVRGPGAISFERRRDAPGGVGRGARARPARAPARRTHPGAGCRGAHSFGDDPRARAARGVACWLASHAADFVAATCEDVVALAGGRVAFEGAPAELWRDPTRAAASELRFRAR